jgi:pyridoxal phosphate enzyme (YggS family)
MGQVADNLARVRDRIEAACQRAGRDPGSVRLMAVSKTHGPELVEEAYVAGVRLFGENRVQEAVEKAEQVTDHPDLVWAMIGHLQTNKARAVAGFAREFHALESIKVAEALHRRLHDTGRDLDVFIQVNSSDEPQKHGLRPEQVEAFAHDLVRFGTLRVRGLMTLAVFSDDRTAVESCFARMRSVQRDLQQAGAPGSYDELSMGMSGDFELAIEYGATTVRVGEAIFGPRLSK